MSADLPITPANHSHAATICSPLIGLRRGAASSTSLPTILIPLCPHIFRLTQPRLQISGTLPWPGRKVAGQLAVYGLGMPTSAITVARDILDPSSTPG